jgi:hypothetical protein
MRKRISLILLALGGLTLISLLLNIWSLYRIDTVAGELQTLRAPLMEAAQPAVEPVTIAFVSDTETLSRWDEVLQLIADEGAGMLVHNGDYISGLNPELMEQATFEDFASQEITDGNGNGTGEFDCDRPLQGIRCILGPDFPVLGAATGRTIGPPLDQYYLKNVTAIEEAGGRWGGCIMVGEPGQPGVRGSGCFDDDNLANARAGDYWVRWQGITIVFQNAMPDTSWVSEVLQGDNNIWKICAWHGNHIDFQTGDKGAAYDATDRSLPYEMYRNCADHGALIINGNEHTYSRTCVMEDIGNLDDGGPAFPNRVNREPGSDLQNHGAICPNAGVSNEEAVNVVEELEIGPGRSMVLVSSLPGYAWREYIPQTESLIEQDLYRHAYDGWWATMYTANRYCRNNCTNGDLSAQNTEAFVAGMNPPISIEQPEEAPWDPYSNAHGVLFITFNYEGDPYKAHGYFKKLTPDPATGREIIDEFVITYNPEEFTEAN